MNPYIQYMYSYPHKTAYRPLPGVFLKDYMSFLEGQGHGLYLHLPFCRTKCGYCNLFSVTGQKSGQIDRYLEAVERQSRQYQELLRPRQTTFSDLVIGGGTPLLLTDKQLEHMFCMLKELFVLETGAQIVTETSPNETTREKLEVLRQAGVTRISMGVQSFIEEELCTLRRRHSPGQARKSLALIKEHGFPCVNVDFIYGIPGQTVESLLSSLKEALTFEPEELFLYPLYIKHGAGLAGEGVVPDPESALLQYREASAYLRASGFRQDSMRRFVKSSRPRTYTECGFGTSLALGCGGRSYLGNLHFCSPYAITREGCLTQLHAFLQTRDYTKITHGIFLNQEEEKRRMVIRHLLIYPGLSISGYEGRFGSRAREDFPVLKKWEDMGFVTLEDGYLALTKSGLALSDWLGPALMSEAVRDKMKEWEQMYERA